MNLTPENLQKQWDSIKYKDGGFYRLIQCIRWSGISVISL